MSVFAYLYRHLYSNTNRPPSQTKISDSTPDMGTCFQNLIVGLHDIYTLNTHVKFCVNQMLFNI